MIDTLESAAPIQLSVQFCRSLSVLADPLGDPGSDVRHAVQQAVESVVTRFGIPGPLELTVTADGPEVGDGGKVLRLGVGGRTIRYPDEILRLAWSYVTGKLLDPQVTPAFIQARLLEDASSSDRADHVRVVQFLSLTCGKIVEREPAGLLGLPQCRAYASAAGAVVRADPEWLLGVLRKVLDLRISIADRRRVASVLEKSQAGEAGVIEDLVSALRRDSIDILLTKTTLRQLTTAWPADASTVFPFLRDGLFEELGISLPGFRFVVVRDQLPGSFAFRLNDFTSIPILALQPGQLMVNDSVERLHLSGFADAVPIANPATGQPNGVIDASADRQAQAMGLTTWTESGHLILAIAEFLRRYGWCTVHRAQVQWQLRMLGTAFQALVSTTSSRHTDDEITGLVRALARDRISVQNLRTILESLVDFDLSRETQVPPGAAVVAPDAAAHARTALGQAIAHQAARGTDTIVVYLVDPEIERLTAESAAAVGEEERDAILNAFRKEMAYLPPTAQVPGILTSIGSRATLQRLVATEYPRMSVIAHEELPPGRNVQPVARVAL